MPRHEFGIMQTAPKAHKRYDDYEPEKYKCISVDDDFIEPLLEKFNTVRFFWHTLDRAEMGLAYWGVTLIPPESLGQMIEIISDNKNLSELTALLNIAEKEKNYVIHFGL